MERQCEQCGTIFNKPPSGNKRFCNQFCYWQWEKINKHGINHPSYKGGKVSLLCKVCGKEYFVIPARTKISVVCSRECYGVWRSRNYAGENHPLWKGAGETFYTWSKEWRELRLYILKRDKYKCQRCGLKEKRSLQVHHIIPFAEGQTHFFAVTLCNSCHTKIHRNDLK